jgi:DNA-binding transcriptional regulator PaaX
MSGSRAAEKLSIDVMSFILKCVSTGITSAYSITQQSLRVHKSPLTESEIKHRLKYAHQLGYVSSKNADTKVKHFQVTPKGEQKLALLNFRAISFDKESWDGLWRIVMFDIPEQHRSARDLIRNLIKQIGMKQLQQSVWITPAPCAKEFNQLRTAYGISQHLLLLEVRDFELAQQFKHHWNI